MALQRIDTRGALKSGQGFTARVGDYSMKATYSERFTKRSKPVHVMFVIDASGSMSGSPTTAVLEEVESISSCLTCKQDSISMWTFNDKVLHKLKPRGAQKVDFLRLRRDVSDHIGGLTRLHDALYTVCKAWDSDCMKHAATFMVFLTDGGENNSKFSKAQVQRELARLAGTMDKLIFLTAGSSNNEVAQLRGLLEDIPKNKYVLKSACSNQGSSIKELFGFAQHVIQEVVVRYYHKGKEVASSKFVAHGGGKQKELGQAALQDLNTKMRQMKVSIQFH